MTGSDGDVRETWRRYLAERCAEDVSDLLDRYPERRSLSVDLVDLYDYDAAFTVDLFAAPERYLRAAAAVLRERGDAVEHVAIRVVDNPAMLSLESLRARHVTELVTAEAVVESVGPVGAAAAVAVFACPACGGEVATWPLGVRRPEPPACGECDAGLPLAFRPDRSAFVDCQRVAVGAPDADDGAPTVDLFLTDDLVDAVGTGDRFLVTAIVRPLPSGPSNGFRLALDGLGVAEERSAVADRSLAEVIRSRWESTQA